MSLETNITHYRHHPRSHNHTSPPATAPPPIPPLTTSSISPPLPTTTSPPSATPSTKILFGYSTGLKMCKTGNRPSEGSENSIGVSGRACCGCRHPCSCNPCNCNGYAIGPSTVSLSASVAPRLMPLEGSEKSTEAESEGILPKTRVMTVDECRPCQFGAIMDHTASLMT